MLSVPIIVYPAKSNVINLSFPTVTVSVISMSLTNVTVSLTCAASIASCNVS